MADLDTIRQQFLADLATARSAADLAQLRSRYAGKKGLVTASMKLLSSVAPEDRPAYGKSVNDLKTFVEQALEAREAASREDERKARLAAEAIDITLPGRSRQPGSVHPLNRVMQEMIDIFSSMGFDIEVGPEVEFDHYNFEALNIPKDHPARDMQDTFYISDDVLLRTHTSPVQVRVMEKKRPPLKFIAPGKVYRCDADVTHSPMFHQVEGLVVDTDITFSDLKGLLEVFLQRMFSKDTPVRFRPSFFPFTEPSAEVDIGCILC
jgi:phenylalanyl-tRNA synthetase alpha chain